MRRERAKRTGRHDVGDDDRSGVHCFGQINDVIVDQLYAARLRQDRQRQVDRNDGTDADTEQHESVGASRQARSEWLRLAT